MRKSYSYVRENREVVDKLYNELKSRGIEVWLDRRDIGPGVRWKREIKKAIQQGAFFIACFSKAYHERDKTYMNEELIVAIEELRQLHIDRVWFIPIILDDCEVPGIDIDHGVTLKDLNYVNLYENWNAGIQRILNTIQPESPDPISHESSTGQESDQKSAKFSESFTDRDSVDAEDSSRPGSTQNSRLTGWVFQQGNFLFKHKQIDRAVEAYSHAIDLAPRRPVTYGNRGSAYHVKGDYDRATADYSKAIELNPHDAEVYYNRGVAYSDRCELELAITDYTKAIELKPDDADVYNNSGIAHGKKGEYDCAIRDFTKVVQLDPHSTSTYNNRGIAHSRNGDVEAAIKDFTKAIELKSDYTKAYYNRGIAHSRNGDVEAAIKDFNMVRTYAYRSFVPQSVRL